MSWRKAPVDPCNTSGYKADKIVDGWMTGFDGQRSYSRGEHIHTLTNIQIYKYKLKQLIIVSLFPFCNFIDLLFCPIYEKKKVSEILLNATVAQGFQVVRGLKTLWFDPSPLEPTCRNIHQQNTENSADVSDIKPYIL